MGFSTRGSPSPKFFHQQKKQWLHYRCLTIPLPNFFCKREPRYFSGRKTCSFTFSSVAVTKSNDIRVEPIDREGKSQQDKKDTPFIKCSVSTIDPSSATMPCKKNCIIALEQRRYLTPTSMPSNNSDNSNNDEAANPCIVPIPSSTSVPLTGGSRGSHDTVLSIIDAALSILEESEVIDSGRTDHRSQ